jgi:hypothetical protein
MNTKPTISSPAPVAVVPATPGKITSARITNLPQTMCGPCPEVLVQVGGQLDEVKLFDYFSDEISFRPEEFIGLTVDEGRNLKFKKDVAFLRS